MAEFFEVARQYVQWDPNTETRREISNLLEASQLEKLRSLLSSRLAFGTAGLRAAMGAGYARMNDLVILQTTQGLLKYLDRTVPGAAAAGVVIGFDHRRLGTLSSRGFAEISAAVFVSRGYKVYFLTDFVATPFVAFGVHHFKAAAGIMVTASHNPKQDNGFKVYWGNGSQIIPPHDHGIASCIEENLEPWQVYDVASIYSSPLLSQETGALSAAYMHQVETLCRYKSVNSSSSLRVAYTAMHGVGEQWVKRAFEAFGHPPAHSVPSQAKVDPDFSTVSFPNPEEKGALNEAMRFADETNCSLIVANDPDADRLAAAERLPDGRWHLFSGNEVGVLMGHWQISQWKRRHSEGGSGRVPAVLASVVSSRMLSHIAKVEGVQYFDTLTGFKWLGNKSLELQSEGTQVLFAYEEALGFCVGNVVCDKDGVSAAAVFVEMANYLASGESNLLGLSKSVSPTTVYGHLRSLAAKYGEFVSLNSYIICRDPVKTDAIFHRIRCGGQDGSYIRRCAGVDAVAVKDVTKGFDSANIVDGTSDLPVTPDSHMIMFTFANGVTVTLRTSGTEPKIKYYTEIAGRPGEERGELEGRLKSFVEQVIDEYLQPEQNGLQRG